MAYVTTNTSKSDATLANLRAAAADVFKSLNQRRLVHKTVSELSKLSDAEMQDLGINRSEIKSVARQAVYGL